MFLTTRIPAFENSEPLSKHLTHKHQSCAMEPSNQTSNSFFHSYLDESPRWLIVKGHRRAAKRVLQKSARLNKASLPSEDHLDQIMTLISREEVSWSAAVSTCHCWSAMSAVFKNELYLCALLVSRTQKFWISSNQLGRTSLRVSNNSTFLKITSSVENFIVSLYKIAVYTVHHSQYSSLC